MIFEKRHHKLLTSILKTLLCAFVLVSFYSCSFFISNEIPESKPEETITQAEVLTTEPGKLQLIFTPDFTGKNTNNSRSAYPDFSNISALGLTFSIKSENLTETAGTYDSTTGKIKFEIPSREFTDEDFTVFANKSGKQILFATVALSYTENGASTTISDSISFRPYTAADGNTDEQKGSVTLKISVSDSNGSYEGYKIVTVIEGDTENKIKVTSNDRSNTIRTENTEDGKVSSGSYLAKISVYKNDHLINYILQTIVVWPGMDTNCWYLSDGSFSQVEYHITATDEITCYVCGENPAGLYNATNGLPSLTDVASPEDTNDGTILAPLASISAAIEKCVNEEVKYTIICDGKLEGFSITGNKRLLTIKGGGNSSNYSSITSRISVQSFSDVTLENISISGISVTNAISAYFYNNNNKLTLNNCSIKNIYDNGAAVITCNSASNKNVTLELNNTVLKVDNYAINITGDSNKTAQLILKGSTYIDPSTEYDWWNSIMVNKFTSIIIDGPLVDSHQIIAKINMPSGGSAIPESGTQLITVQNGADLAKESQRFEILSFPKVINTEGKIALSKDYYVASASSTPAGSSSGNGSSKAPVDTVTAAVALVKATANTEGGAGDYTIHISGTIIEDNTISIMTGDTNTLGNFTGSTLKLSGTNHDNDKLDGNNGHEVLDIRAQGSPLNITIENLSIQNSSMGSGIAASGEGLVLKLGNGALLTKNKSSYDAGAVKLNYYASLVMYGSAQIGVPPSTNTAPTDADQAIANGGNAITSGNGGAIYVEPNSSVFIGYNSASEDDPDNSFTGGIYGNYSSGDGGAIYSNGKVYINKATISYNSAVDEGGGIYKYGNDSIVSLKDVTMQGNKAAEGGALHNNLNEIEIKGIISIPAGEDGKNDVFLENGAKLKITDQINPPDSAGGIAATITPGFYSEGSKYLNDNSSGTKVAANYDKFAVTPKVSGTPPVITSWDFTSTGVLKKVPTLNFVTINSQNTDKFDGTQAITDSLVFITDRNLGRMNSLEVGDHEITQGEYEKYMTYYGVANNIGTDKPTSSYGIGKYYPVYNINWYEAIMYCNLRSKAEGLTPAYYLYNNGTKLTEVSDWANISDTKISYIESGSRKLYYYNSQVNNNSILDRTGSSDTQYIGFDEEADGWRLPTEAEWEWLARECDLTDTTHYYSGGTNSSDVGWCQGDTGVGTSSHEIKGKNANNKNIYDMTGNVMEWCWDLYSTTILPVAGRTGLDYSSNNTHSLRGGSWDYDCKITKGSGKERTGNNAGTRYQDCGFRIVRTTQYYGPIGNKMKPDAVGDIVFNDGSAVDSTAYTNGKTLTQTQKDNAIAVIFYKGSALSKDGTTERLLGVGFVDKIGCWASADSLYYQNVTITSNFRLDQTGKGDTATFTPQSNVDGTRFFEEIKTFVDYAPSPDYNYSSKYPAFYFSAHYDNQSGSNVNGTAFADSWYFPTLAEVNYIYRQKTIVTQATTACKNNSGINFNSYSYLSASETSTQGYIYSYNISDGSADPIEKTSNGRICAIREF